MLLAKSSAAMHAILLLPDCHSPQRYAPLRRRQITRKIFEAFDIDLASLTKLFEDASDGGKKPFHECLVHTLSQVAGDASMRPFDC